jgi:SMODS domain-containing protein
MNSLTAHFVKFISNIQPDGNRIELAMEIPDQLRGYLKDTDKMKTVDPHTRLSGSYARYTAIKEIKDVDILLFISEDHKDGEASVKKAINELISALKGFPDYLKDETGKVDADLALRRQRRSVQVHLTFGGQKFDIDVVPSINDGGIKEPLLVPDRDLSKWVRSHPLGYGYYLSEANKDNSDKIVPLIKVLKHWRDIQMKRKRPKSYWLECLVCKYAADGQLDVKDSSWGELFLSLLMAVHNDFCEIWNDSTGVPVIKDPMLGKNVAKSWTRDEFDYFMRRIEESKRWAEKALNEEDEKKAIEIWQKLFNDEGEEYFPCVVDEAFVKALSAGSLYVSSSGKVLSNPSKVEKSWPAPSHRNYGDV